VGRKSERSPAITFIGHVCKMKDDWMLRYVARHEELNKLISNLRTSGYTVIAPKLVDGVLSLAPVESLDQIPKGAVDRQGPGEYEIKLEGSSLLSAVNGPMSPKSFLHPAVLEVFRLNEDMEPQAKKFEGKLAFFCIRPCDLKAVQVLDRVLLRPGYEDPAYSARRSSSLIFVANCVRAGENCFCASMGTGPRAVSGYDMAITELRDRFVLDVAAGRMWLVRGLDLRPASNDDLLEEDKAIERAERTMTKKIEHPSPADAMYEGLDSPIWDEFSQRCLACGNCTMVCPTCFCTSVHDVENLAERSVGRIREWDSCLSKSFSYMHGYNPRLSRKARYRQFVMHKFAYWTEQFQSYGCVGCGRCITWCPVGIDITEVVNQIVRSVGEKRSLPEVVKVA